MEMTVQATQIGDESFRVTVDANFPFSIETDFSDPDLLMAASLVQEAILGIAFPRDSELSREEWEETFQLS